MCLNFYGVLQQVVRESFLLAILVLGPFATIFVSDLDYRSNGGNMKATKYELSKDRLGLKKHFIGPDGKKTWYHVHSDELTKKERAIRDKLLKEAK